MLHPAVLAGVWDHSNFQTDLHGRLRRTARFIALTTYGGRAEAETAIARVRRIHESVQGSLANGTAYSANDPSLLAWVHVTEAMSFLGAWIRYAEPTMSAADQDRYFTEVARIASALGANPVPQSRAEADDVVQLMKPCLLCDGRTRQIARLVLTEPAPSIMLEPLRLITTQAALELLPGWARCMHGMSEPGLDWLVRASALGSPRRCAGSFGDERLRHRRLRGRTRSGRTIETDRVDQHDRGRIHRSVTDREHVSGGVADRDRINACRRMTP